MLELLLSLRTLMRLRSHLQYVSLASTRANLYAALVLLHVSLLVRILLLSQILCLEVYRLLDTLPEGSIDVATPGRCSVAGHARCMEKSA